MILPFIPKNIQIEISNRCNLKCPMCPRGQNKAIRNKDDIDIDFFKAVITELQEYNTKIQLWNYGEPFLHKQIKLLIQSIPKKFSDCSISTNGHFMTKKLAKSIIASGITEIIFAIDGIIQIQKLQFSLSLLNIICMKYHNLENSLLLTILITLKLNQQC